MATKNPPPPPPAAIVNANDNDEDEDDFDVFADDDGEAGDFEFELPAYLEPHLNDLQASIAAYETREYGNPFSDEGPQAPSPERLAADHKLVLALLPKLEGKGVEAASDAAAALDERFGGMVYDWLSDVGFNLADAGKVDEGVALAQRLGKALDAQDEFGGDAASMLARAGKTELATRQVDELLSRFGTDLSVCDRMADVLVTLGDHKRAEKLTRKVLERTQDGGGLASMDVEDDENFILRSSALERMVQLLEARGAKREAAPLRAELASVEEGIGAITESLGAGAMGGLPGMPFGLGQPAQKAPEWGYDPDPSAAPKEPVAAVRAGGPKEKPKKK